MMRKGKGKKGKRKKHIRKMSGLGDGVVKKDLKQSWIDLIERVLDEDFPLVKVI